MTSTSSEVLCPRLHRVRRNGLTAYSVCTGVEPSLDADLSILFGDRIWHSVGRKRVTIKVRQCSESGEHPLGRIKDAC